jgi:hypothetical protein
MKDLDFALMIKVLYTNGHSLSDMARDTDIAIGTMSVVKQETKNPPAGWYEGINLLDYWLRATGKNPPRVGDHIDIEGEDYGIDY